MARHVRDPDGLGCSGRVLCSLFSVLCSLFWGALVDATNVCFGAVPVPRSPFSVRYSGRARAGFGAVPRRSPFSVLRAPCSVLRSPFSVLRSPFSVLRSPFSVLRSPFS
eukprot:5780776-Prymnesium_polylepis.1